MSHRLGFTLVVASLAIGGCAGSRESDTEPPRWVRLEQTCSTADNPSFDVVGEAPDIAISVPVKIDPSLAVQTQWATAGFMTDDERVIWYPARVLLESGRVQFRRDRSLLMMKLASYDDGRLELMMVPRAGDLNSRWASARIVRIADDLRAELRSGDEIGSERAEESDFRGGELRLSSASWVAGDELGIFLDVALEDYRICGEVRVVVPEPGFTESVLCTHRRCI